MRVPLQGQLEVFLIHSASEFGVDEMAPKVSIDALSKFSSPATVLFFWNRAAVLIRGCRVTR